jgi:hypothetical protein
MTPIRCAALCAVADNLLYHDGIHQITAPVRRNSRHPVISKTAGPSGQTVTILLR